MDCSKKCSWILLPCFCICLVIYLLPEKRNFASLAIIRSTNQLSYSLDQQKEEVDNCPMPNFDPFHPSVKGLYKKLPAGYRCSGKPSFLTIKPNALVELDEWRLWQHHSLRRQDISCTYQEIIRDPGDTKHPTDDKFKFRVKKKMKFSVPLGLEFLRVVCVKNNNTIIDEYLALTPLKPQVERRSDENLAKLDLKEKLNVIVIGIDSISRLNFIRHFHNTRQFLKNNLTTFQLKRYNKVADNTFPNLTPLLTGHFVKDYMNRKFFDDIDFVWKHYSDVGYRTLLAEDAPKIATYNYLKKGFKKPATDYYLRPFNLAVESSQMKKKSRHHCFGNKLEMKVILDYVRSFVDTMDKRPYFAFAFVARLTHDVLNNAAYADQPVYDILRHLKATNVTENSMVVLMSDHGIRFGKIRETYIGKFEERWPIMHLSFPNWFLKKYPSLAHNLKVNQDRLTTPFDVHNTLVDVLQIIKTGEYDPGLQDSTLPNGISLFQEISLQRTCEDAAILPHWYTCQMKVAVPVNTKQVRLAADALVNKLNQLITKVPTGCALMSLSNIKDAHYSKLDNSSDSTLDYLLTISVDPSNAYFEGTVRYSNKKYQVSGDISRINHYGNEGDCVSDSTLRKFCYCK